MSEADPLLGRVISSKFRVEKLLGAGAMGRVYRAHQENLDKPVAIKVLSEKVLGDAALEKRFLREAKHASALSHPNIVQMIDFGQDGDLLFIAMELLTGRDLGKVLKADGVFGPDRLAHVVGQVLSALEESHEKGIVHRDLKPENVMLVDVRGEPDFVKVCDFGIAKAQTERGAEGSAITMAGMVCGTPEYMSPEQARGDTLDGRSDLYSVACILYQLACGELPFKSETALGLVTKHLHEAPVPPSKRGGGLALPEALEAVILRGLEKECDKRFASATQMREALYGSVGIRRPASGQVKRAPSAEATEMALAATGVATPAQPQPASGSVHGEMAAATATTGGRRRVWIGAAVAGVVMIAGVVHMYREPPPTPPIAAAAQPPAPKPEPPPPPPAPVKVEPPPAPKVEAPPPPAPEEPPRKKDKKEKKPKIAKNTKPEEPAKPAENPKPAEPARTGFQAVFAEAEALFKSGSIEPALAKYQEAAKLNGAHAGTQRQIGKCYNRLGQRDKAQPYFKRYLELAPNAADADFIKAMLQ